MACMVGSFKNLEKKLDKGEKKERNFTSWRCYLVSVENWRRLRLRVLGGI